MIQLWTDGSDVVRFKGFFNVFQFAAGHVRCGEEDAFGFIFSCGGHGRICQRELCVVRDRFVVCDLLSVTLVEKTISVNQSNQ